MSSILRALRRLESDARHDEEDNATLHEHVVFAGSSRRSGKRGVLAAAALVFVGVGALAAAVLRSGGEGASPPVVRERVGARAPTAPPRAAIHPADRFVEGEPRPQRIDAVAAAPRRRAPVAAVEAPPPRVEPASAAPAPPTLDLPKDQVPRRAAAPSRKGAPAGVERILWHPSAEKRRAWLRVDGDAETREVREGEQVGRYAVTRIDAGSVLFRSGTTELRYKLGATPR